MTRCTYEQFTRMFLSCSYKLHFTGFGVFTIMHELYFMNFTGFGVFKIMQERKTYSEVLTV